MDIDLELYRGDVFITSNQIVRLSVIDISPDHPKRTIVFVHGFGGQALQWKYQLQEFSLENRVVAIDLRGHGNSDKPNSSYTMEEIQGDLRAVLEFLKIKEPIILVGHSFGGAVAIEYAFNQPEKVDKLILIATAGEFKLNPLFRVALNLPAPILALMRPFTKNWLSAPPRVLKDWYKNNLSRWNGWEILESIEVPALIIRGHRDFIFDSPLFERVSSLIPNSEDVDIGASGHLVMLERHDAVNRCIERSLAGARRTWRETNILGSSDKRDDLLKNRPWLAYYSKGTPYTICIPRIPIHHLLKSAVRRFAKHTALVFEGGKLNYGQLNSEVVKFANGISLLGMNKGTRVAIILPNSPQSVISYFGTLQAGGVAVLIPSNEQPDDLIQLVKDANPAILVILTIWTGLVRRILAETKISHIILTSPNQYSQRIKKLLSNFRTKNVALSSTLLWEDIVNSKINNIPSIDVFPDDLAVIEYTGGTTSDAKGVMLSHRNLVANTLQTRHWMPSAKEGNERFLCAIPFSHSYGLTATLNVPISLGAELILQPSFNVEYVMNSIRKYKPTIFPGVPNMYVAINGFHRVRKYNLSSINACISGSAPLPVEVQETFEKLTRGKLVEGYGLTEASPITHANPLEGIRKVGSIGIPIPSTEAKILDLKTSRKELSSGQIGEMAVRGPQVMMGYWHNPEATKKALTNDGWLLTGDVATRDTDGYFRIVARKTDMWYPQKPGNPAFPRDVEEVLYEIPQVREAAVVAIAGSPVAFIISRNEKISSESILAYCRRRLHPSVVPRLVIFLDDFPRTIIGKVLRRELAKGYEQYSRKISTKNDQ